jgi:hypothetical protein
MILCLYTDGLIERRGQPLTAGLERLTAAMFAGPVDSVCAAVMQAMVGAESPSDDIALLVLRRRPVASTGALDLQLLATPASLQALRRAMRRWLTGIGVGGHSDRRPACSGR